MLLRIRPDIPDRAIDQRSTSRLPFVALTCKHGNSSLKRLFFRKVSWYRVDQLPGTASATIVACDRGFALKTYSGVPIARLAIRSATARIESGSACA
jgi:hypothetical protein